MSTADSRAGEFSYYIGRGHLRNSLITRFLSPVEFKIYNQSKLDWPEFENNVEVP